MRIIGYIDHSRIKITVFEDNNKIILQCEDGLCQQTFKFRSGGVVDDIESIKKLVDVTFITQIENNLSQMASQRVKALQKATKAFEDEFDEII